MAVAPAPSRESAATTMNGGRRYPCGKAKQDGVTLLDHLAVERKRMFSRPAWKRRISRGQVGLKSKNDQCMPWRICRKPSHILSQGDEIVYHRPPWLEPAPPSSLEILYEDDHMMVVNKPSGLPVMPSQTFETFTALHVLRSVSPEVANADEAVSKQSEMHLHTENHESSSCAKSSMVLPLQPVHRLGVGTSGALICAKTQLGRTQLSRDIRERRVKKVYRALVTRGNDIPDQLRIDCPIGPVPYPMAGGSLNAARPLESGSDCATQKIGPPKPALSIVKVLSRNQDEDTAVVEVEIPTGRPHQIRIHMAYAGHPLVGDPLFLAGGVPNMMKSWFPAKDRLARDASTSEEDNVESDSALDSCDFSTLVRSENVMETSSCSLSSAKLNRKGWRHRVALPRDCGYFLHAVRLELNNFKGETITVNAPPPNRLR